MHIPLTFSTPYHYYNYHSNNACLPSYLSAAAGGAPSAPGVPLRGLAGVAQIGLLVPAGEFMCVCVYVFILHALCSNILCTHIHTYSHTNTYAHIHTHIPRPSHTHIPRPSHTHISPPPYTYIPTHTHTFPAPPLPHSPACMQSCCWRCPRKCTTPPSPSTPSCSRSVLWTASRSSCTCLLGVLTYKHIGVICMISMMCMICALLYGQHHGVHVRAYWIDLFRFFQHL